MPYKDPTSPVAIESRKQRQLRSSAKRRRVREEYLRTHPEARQKEVTPESDNARRQRESAGSKEYRKSERFRKLNRSANLKCRRGITTEQRDVMIQGQHGLCLICDFPLTFIGRGGPAVDHDHETGKIRGILHRTCNAAIGLLQDNPKILRKAAEYLETSHAIEL